jgi:hypothetical protein
MVLIPGAGVFDGVKLGVDVVDGVTLIDGVLVGDVV